MEPIFKNTHFADLLRVWRFVTIYYEYLELPEQIAQLSLYELNEHVHNPIQTQFINTLIQALVRKSENVQKSKRMLSIFHLAKYNRHKQILKDLSELSAYELAISQVITIVQWKSIFPDIDFKKPYDQLSLEARYKFFSLLADFVYMSAQFKNYLKNLKQQYNDGLKVEGANYTQLIIKHTSKLNSYYVLGKDSQEKVYFYISNIGDSILVFNSPKKQWRRIQGKDKIKQLVQNILKKIPNIPYYQIDLLQSLNEIWNKKSWNTKTYAFEKNKKLFDIKDLYKHNAQQKVKIMKQKLVKLQQEYSKFLSNCWNSRWANKERRIQFLKQVNAAKQMPQLFQCFRQFFNQTKHSSQRKIKNYQFYDYSLQTPQVAAPEQFKHIFLRMNYLYVNDVIAQTLHQPMQKKDYNRNLYSFIKQLIQNSQTPIFHSSLFQYLYTFVTNMTNIVLQLYPSKYQNRLKDIEQEEKRIQQREREEEKNKEKMGRVNKKSKLRLKKYQGRNEITVDLQSSQDGGQQGESNQSGSDEDSSTVQNGKGARIVGNGGGNGGRRLRQRAKISYKLTNSRQKKPKMKHEPLGQRKSSRLNNIKSLGLKARQRSKSKKGKKSKLLWDSDQQQSITSQQTQLSITDSFTQQKSTNALNLNQYEYIQDDDNETQNFRRMLRSSKEKGKK